MRLSSIVIELYRVICEKSPILTYPTCTWLLHWGWPRPNFAQIYISKKTRVLGLSCGVACVIVSLAVLIQFDDCPRPPNRPGGMSPSSHSSSLSMPIYIWRRTTAAGGRRSVISTIVLYSGDLREVVGGDGARLGAGLRRRLRRPPAALVRLHHPRLTARYETRHSKLHFSTC